VDANPGTVFIAGDIAYPQGSERDFAECFEPTWGRFRPRWRPVPGNHEYETPGADAYFRYFGNAAGPDRRGYYFFHAGNWLVVMLNSNVPFDRASAQLEFLDDVLDSDERRCTLAIWHHPLFSSGQNGPNPFVRDAWRELHEENADVVVNGHDHLYERFAPQDPDGRSDPTRGLRQFIAGSGGAHLYSFVRSAPNSEARISAFGVLKLTLEPSSYRWEFIEGNGAITDRGAGLCH
jgi:3',5'-cyclic AMP phosphodiesterase CpdA